MTDVVSLSFFRFDRPAGRLWAFVQMGLSRGPMARTPDIKFWKLCGAGRGEGFTPVALPRTFAILATWPDAVTARARVEAGVWGRFRRKSDESWTVFLSATQARGAWSGVQPFGTGEATPQGRVAALTRATLRPRAALRFWKRVPDISARIGADPNVMFKIGIGEIPLMHQVTFSIWPDESQMAAFARTGPHAEAIRAVREEGWFHEELYARFSVLSETGSWGGTSPLATGENP